MKSPGLYLTKVLVLRGRLIPASSPPEPISWLHEGSKPKRIKKSLLISQPQMVFSHLRNSGGRRGMQEAPAPHPRTESQVDPHVLPVPLLVCLVTHRGGASQKVQHIFVLRDGYL